MSGRSSSERVRRPELHSPDRKGGEGLRKRKLGKQRLPGLKITDEVRGEGLGTAWIVIKDRLDAQAGELMGRLGPYKSVEN